MLKKFLDNLLMVVIYITVIAVVLCLAAIACSFLLQFVMGFWS